VESGHLADGRGAVLLTTLEPKHHAHPDCCTEKSEPGAVFDYAVKPKGEQVGEHPTPDCHTSCEKAASYSKQLLKTAA
jgi:hypothetical protein